MFKEGSVRLIKGDTLTFSITYKLKPTLSSPSASSLVFADVRRCRATRVDLTTRSSSQRVQGQIIDIKDSSRYSVEDEGRACYAYIVRRNSVHI